MKTAEFQAKGSLRQYARSSPTAFGLIGRMREDAKYERRVVRRGDDLVIEGYPRSANSFATQAFRMAQPSELLIGNHTHAAGQVVRAAKFGIPCMLVVRSPREAIASFLVYHDGALDPMRAIAEYCDFYAAALKHSDHWTHATFDEVTRDFSVSIERLNRRFGTTYAPYENSAENDAQVRSYLDTKRKSLALDRGQDDRASALKATIPSEIKKRRRESLVAQLDSPRAESALAEAEELYGWVTRDAI